MATLKELMQDYVNMSYNDLLNLARKNYANFIGTLRGFFDSDETIAQAILVVTSSCLSADGKLSNSEYAFIKELLGLQQDYETLTRVTAALGDAKGRELADQLADALDTESKAEFLSFCLCIVAIDETISRDEIAFINKLLD